MSRYVVPAGDAGRRVDAVVARVASAPRSAVARAIREGAVWRNGAPVEKAGVALEEGDALDYRVELPRPLELVAQAIPLDIAYEDSALIVVNKPAGMVTHPARGSRDGTLVNALLAHVGALPGEQPRPGLVHRLDRDTSGLIVVAKTPQALAALGKALARRYVRREYIGLVFGAPERERGTIEGAIGRDPHNRMKFAIRTDGKPAVTHYALRERLAGASELTFTLETGRTHQIRVHMAALGNPIVNDPVYGRRDPRVALEGQALHAWRLGFRHPVTHEELQFEATPPEAYAKAKEALRA